jgi:preprotein translocase SecE subunit
MSKDKSSTKKTGKAEAERPALGQRMRDYFVSLKYEWQKVTFPTRKELIQSTLVVFLFTIILMAIISAYDVGMSFAFNRFVLPISEEQ